jgi:hypothetical protein
MKNLAEKVENYAAEKTQEVMTKAIAQAYADGYRDGYKDREEEIPVDLRDYKTEYVDLGLPSGTLWASDYEKDEEGNIRYLPFGSTCNYKIPTREQWEELEECCKWELKTTLLNIHDKPINWKYGLTKMTCVGPNGNYIHFDVTGYFFGDIQKDLGVNSYKTIHGKVYFWILTEDGEKEFAVIIKNNEYNEKDPRLTVSEIFSGWHLPIRLVRSK